MTPTWAVTTPIRTMINSFGDPVTLTGTVTRVGSSMVEELVPVSLAVDGYTATRVTLAAKSLRRA